MKHTCSLSPFRFIHLSLYFQVHWLRRIPLISGTLCQTRHHHHHQPLFTWRHLLLWNAPEWRISNDCWGILSPWLKKILSFTALKCSRMKDFQWLLGNTFTMVEENFEFYCSEMLQNEWFPMIIWEHFHHGWRKFWVLLLQNAPEWGMISGS